MTSGCTVDGVSAVSAHAEAAGQMWCKERGVAHGISPFCVRPNSTEVPMNNGSWHAAEEKDMNNEVNSAAAVCAQLPRRHRNRYMHNHVAPHDMHHSQHTRNNHSDTFHYDGHSHDMGCNASRCNSGHGDRNGSYTCDAGQLRPHSVKELSAWVRHDEEEAGAGVGANAGSTTARGTGKHADEPRVTATRRAVPGVRDNTCTHRAHSEDQTSRLAPCASRVAGNGVDAFPLRCTSVTRPCSREKGRPVCAAAVPSVFARLASMPTFSTQSRVVVCGTRRAQGGEAADSTATHANKDCWCGGRSSTWKKVQEAAYVGLTNEKEREKEDAPCLVGGVSLCAPAEVVRHVSQSSARHGLVRSSSSSSSSPANDAHRDEAPSRMCRAVPKTAPPVTRRVTPHRSRAGYVAADTVAPPVRHAVTTSFLGSAVRTRPSLTICASRVHPQGQRKQRPSMYALVEQQQQQQQDRTSLRSTGDNRRAAKAVLNGSVSCVPAASAAAARARSFCRSHSLPMSSRVATRREEGAHAPVPLRCTRTRMPLTRVSTLRPMAASRSLTQDEASVGAVAALLGGGAQRFLRTYTH